MYPSRQARIPNLDKKTSISVIKQAISFNQIRFYFNLSMQLKVETVTNLFFSIYVALIHKREHYISATMNIQVGETRNESSSKVSTVTYTRNMTPVTSQLLQTYHICSILF